MVTALALGRLIVWLKRICVQLKESNEIAKKRMDLEIERLSMDYPQWERAGRRLPPRARAVTFDKPTVSDWNQHWRERHPDIDG